MKEIIPESELLTLLLIIIAVFMIVYGLALGLIESEKRSEALTDRIKTTLDQKYRDYNFDLGNSRNLKEIDQMLDYRNKCTSIVMQYINHISTAQALEFFMPDKDNSGACLPLDIGKVLTVERKGYIIPNSNADDFYISDDSF